MSTSVPVLFSPALYSSLACLKAFIGSAGAVLLNPCSRVIRILGNYFRFVLIKITSPVFVKVWQKNPFKIPFVRPRR